MGAALEEDFMRDPEPNTEAGLSLSCPACGESLTAIPGSNEMLGCPANHQYTLPTLLFGQSMRASALLEAGARLLEEQERLVRAIALQLWNEQSLAAFKLEGQADRLKETTEALRHLVTDGVLQAAQPLKEVTSSSN
jgi:hypothetical protein